VLNNLPIGIDQLESAYNQSFARIKGKATQDVRLAQQVIYSFTQVRQQLSQDELQEALAVRANDRASQRQHSEN
jgi:hypothetical protein